MFGDPVSNKTLSDLVTGAPGKAQPPAGSSDYLSYLSPIMSLLRSPSAMGLGTIAGGTATRPNNTAADTDALTGAYAAARAANHTPQGRINRGFDQFGPQPAPTPVPVDDGSSPAPYSMGPPPALSAQAQVPPAAAAPAVTTPMPVARPPDAPQASPDMPWWQRNAAMMRDPSTGAFIDPTNADRAQASGPDVINKLLSYFHQKDDPSDT